MKILKTIFRIIFRVFVIFLTWKNYGIIPTVIISMVVILLEFEKQIFNEKIKM